MHLQCPHPCPPICCAYLLPSSTHVWPWLSFPHLVLPELRPPPPHPVRDLVNEHDKRATNHSELLRNLKEVNLMIQRAARLRVGAPKTKVVAACRAAVKGSSTAALIKIIRDGDGN